MYELPYGTYLYGSSGGPLVVLGYRPYDEVSVSVRVRSGALTVPILYTTKGPFPE
jgi:hypothetical protein